MKAFNFSNFTAVRLLGRDSSIARIGWPASASEKGFAIQKAPPLRIPGEEPRSYVIPCAPCKRRPVVQESAVPGVVQGYNDRLLRPPRRISIPWIDPPTILLIRRSRNSFPPQTTPPRALCFAHPFPGNFRPKIFLIAKGFTSVHFLSIKLYKI